MHSQQGALLARLLKRGDQVAIEDGRVTVCPASGNPVPLDWFAANEAELLRDILRVTSVSGLSYDSYSTGNYGIQKYPGVTLQFIDLLTGENPYAVFNANLSKARNSSKGPKGSPLPQGEFSVGKRSKFYSFWLNTQIPLPPRLTRFHEYMGNLRSVVFSGSYSPDGRILKSSLRPLFISYEQVLDGFNCARFTHKSRTQDTQHTDNTLTKYTDRESPESQTNKDFQPYSTTGLPSCGISCKGDTDNGKGYSPSKKPPKEQTTEEWMIDYDLTRELLIPIGNGQFFDNKKVSSSQE